MHSSLPQDLLLRVSKKNCLHRFIVRSYTGRSYPKKEYLRCKLIRGHKKAIRALNLNKPAKAGLAKFNLSNHKAGQIWSEFSKIYQNNSEFFLDKSRTEAGPLTDGKTKRNDFGLPVTRSFNDSFCKYYFEYECIRKSFVLFVQLVFCDFDIKELSQKFNFDCCGNQKHEISCFEKWLSLKEYITGIMMVGVERQPVVKYAQFDSLPNFLTIHDFGDKHSDDDQSDVFCQRIVLMKQRMSDIN